MNRRPRRLWTSPDAVTILTIAAALIVVAAGGALIWYAAAAIDHITEVRETRLMARAIDRRLVRLADDVASVAVWSDAYDKTARTYDPAWADINYGVYFHQYLHHDLSVVVDGRDRPIYVSMQGTVRAPRAAEGFIRGMSGLVARARADAAGKIARKPGALGFDRVGVARASFRDHSHVYLAAASTVVPEPEYKAALLPGPEPVIVSAVEVGPAFLASLHDDLGLRAARLRPADAGVAPRVPLVGPDGRVVAALSWSPERPGAGVFRNARWEIAIGALLVLAAVAMVVARVRRLAEAVLRARDRAEAGDQAKSDFIANMSHEIRTPLNGVLGMVQVMERDELTPAQRERLRVIRESGAALMGLLNDVLDLSKIEAGKLELLESPFRLDELAERVGATFAGLAAAKDLDLQVQVAPDAAGPWLGDGLRLRQVLANLVSNAMKFTDQGAVTLHAERTPEGVRIAVRDTGIGIASDQLPGLFDKFTQADASATRRFGGTGLGLSISHRLVALMGGELVAESRLGEGSTFTVTLPLRPTASLGVVSNAEPAPHSTQRPLRILAAEDNPTNQLVLRALLDGLGAELTLTSDGVEVVEAYRSAAYDLVLMDVQMPRLNGVEAARSIRELETELGSPRTPILALTANVMNHQVEAYREAGMDGHIAKPLDFAAFYGAVESALAAAGEPRREAAA